MSALASRSCGALCIDASGLVPIAAMVQQGAKLVGMPQVSVAPCSFDPHWEMTGEEHHCWQFVLKLASIEEKAS